MTLLKSTKHILIALLFLISTSSVFAQQIDSLKAVWLDESKHDTVRLQAIDRFAWDGYLFRYPDSAFYYAQQEYDYAVKIRNEKYQAAALNTQGVSFLIRGEYQVAMEYLLNSRDIRERINDRFGLSRIYMNLASAYQSQGNFNLAIDYYDRSLKISEQDNFLKLKSTTLNNIGLIYLKQENYAKAREIYSQALELADSIDDQRGLGNLYINMGLVSRNTLKFDEAAAYFRKALSIKERLGDLNGIAMAYNNLGLIFRAKRDYNKAAEYQSKSIEIRRQISDYNGLAVALVSLGLTWIDTDQTRKAEEVCLEAFEIANRINSMDRKKDACECMYEITEKEQDYRTSLGWYRKFILYKDSLDNRETTRKLQRMEISNQMVKDSIARATRIREETLALEAKINRRNSLQYTGIAIVLFVLMSWWFFASRLKLPEWAVNLSLFVPFLILFRFVSMFTEPYLYNFTQGEPLNEMILSIFLAAVVTPTHRFFEKMVRVKILKVPAKDR